ncbi:MAG: hypothetical protein M9896_13955 [Candidatus Promineofilum sp.]|uniref:hypothetical protein n=1 Tax=Promineifilum sp. TaxID=2664178 RepID=UPI00241207B4|nr:hypothetical protein [Promineifilum sp.]
MKRDTTAGIEFAQREKRVNELLYSLLASLEEHREQFDADGRTDWALVSELGEIEAQLTEVKNFINNKE